MKKKTIRILKYPLELASIVLIKYLQRRYKYLCIKYRYNQNNQVISKLILMQHILFYFYRQFSAWGYFHPSCVWSPDDEKRLRKIFTQKDFEEWDILIINNPEALTYYRNELYKYNHKCGANTSHVAIRRQLIAWKRYY